MPRVIKTSYESARREGLCPELDLVGRMDIELYSDSFSEGREEILRKLEEEAEKAGASHGFVNRLSYVLLEEKFVKPILYLLEGEARRESV